MIDQTWFCFENELTLQNEGKWDELWHFEKTKELYENKMLWLIILDVRWHVGMF